MDWLKRKFELARGGDGHNVPSMEGLRGFAVFLVFLVHFVELSAPWTSGASGFLLFTDALHRIGKIGVELFFVLSGYLIYGSLISRAQPYLRFMARRIERIYPAFVAVFGVYIVLSFAFPAENKIPPSAAEAAIYLVENFLLLPGLLPIVPFIGVAWSLSYEMFFYLAIPLVISLLRLRAWNPIMRTALFLLVAAATSIYCAMNGGHIRLILFVSGMLLYEAMSDPRLPRPSSTVGLVALAVALLWNLIPADDALGTTLRVVVHFATLFVFGLACFRDPSAWLPRWFSWTPIRWLGNMSYSYYLIHGIALRAGFLALSFVLPTAMYGSWFFWVLLPPMFVLTALVAAALFLIVERPLSLEPRRAKRTSLGDILQPVAGSAVASDEQQAGHRLP